MPDLTSYLPMYTDPRLQAPATGQPPLYAANNIPLQNTGGVSGTWTPAMTAPVPPVPKVATAAPSAAPVAAAPVAANPGVSDIASFVTTVKGARGGTRGTAMPRTAASPVVANEAAQPLVPGVNGFQVNGGPTVPYGTMFNVSGDGSAHQIGGVGGAGGGLYDGLPGGGKMVNGRFADPRDALEVGFRLQSQYRDESMQRILSLAGDGSQLGYRARVGALAQAFGQNNFGATSVGGANALNSAIAGVTSAGLNAGATLGASENYLTGSLAATGERAQEDASNPHPIGAEPLLGPGGIPMGILPTYGVRSGGPSYTALPTGRPAPTPQEGATGKLKDGRSFVIKNGQPVVTSK